MHILTLEKKQNYAKNLHLKNFSHCGKILGLFLHQSLMLNKSRLIYWEISHTVVNCSRGFNNRHMPLPMFFCFGTSFDTMMKRVEYLRENLDATLKQKLLKKHSFVCCIENNQKVTASKYQHYRGSKNFFKITTSVLKSSSKHI